MSTVPSNCQVIQTFKPLSIATKQWVRDQNNQEDYFCYTINPDAHIDLQKLGRNFNKIDHPCLTKYVSQTNNQLFFKFPSKFTQLTKTTELDDTAKICLIYGVASALNTLHLFNIIHGNLSFASVYVNQKGKPKLFDYGISSQPTHNLRFKSFEVLNGEPPTNKSDVYSFGIFMYKLIMGKNPFATNNNLTQQQPQLEKDKKISEKLLSIINLCLQAEPSSRPTINELLKMMLDQDILLSKTNKTELKYFTDKWVPNNIICGVFEKKAKEVQTKADEGDPRSMIKCGDLYQSANNFEMAFKYYEQAVKKGNREAEWKFGLLYEEGKGVNASVINAKTFYEKSARQDSPQGLYHLGRAYRYGIGLQINKNLAKEYFERAAALGVYEAEYELAAFEEDDKKKEKRYQVAASNQYPPAEFKYGEMLLKKDRQTAMKLILHAVKSDVGEAQLEYGKMILPSNPTKGFKYIRRACDVHKLPEAQYMIAECYYEGKIYKQDYKYALKYIQEAAKMKYPPALYRYAVFLENGIGTQANPSKANKYLNQAAQAKVPAAIYLVGLQYLQKGNEDIALNYIQEAAEMKLPEAQVKYAQMTNTPVPQEALLQSQNMYQSKTPTQGHQLTPNELKKRADDGDVSAMFQLGKLYYYGQQVPQNAQYAVYYIKKAADEGETEAQLMFYLMNKEGRGVPQDLQQAFYYCEMAADNSNPQAMFECGAMLQQGIGVTQDINQAAKYYRQGADLGHKLAQYSYAMCLEYGAGVTKNPQEAIKYYLASAQQSFPDALYAVGRCIEHGIGVQNANIQEALAYYRAAAQAGSADGIKRLRDLNTQ